MANDISIVLEGTLGTTVAPLQSNGSAYTVPVGRKLVIYELCLTNKTAIATNVTMYIGNGNSIFPGKTISANDGYLQQRQSLLLAGRQITGGASNANSIDYYISCLEVDA